MRESDIQIMRHRFYSVRSDTTDTGLSGGGNFTAPPADVTVRECASDYPADQREIEAKREEHESESAHRVLSEALEAISDGFIALDPALRFTYVNAAAEQALGRTRGELIGVSLRDAFPQSAGLPYYEAALRTGTTVNFETSYGSNGQWLDVRAVPTVDGVSIFFRDITQRRMADRMLRASEEWYRALSEHGSDVTFVVDDRNTIRYASRSVERLLGYPADQLVGRTIFEGVHVEDVPIVHEALARLRGNPPIIEGIVYRFRHASGEWRSVETVGSDQTGNAAVAGLVLCSRDVTERIRLQSQLIHSGKLAALGQLVAGVAHEINNPLSAISGYAQLLADHDDPSVREDARAIRGMVERATRIVQALRRFSHPSGASGGGNGGFHSEPKVPGDLNAVVQSALEIVGARLRHAEIEVRVYLEDSLPLVALNPSEMEQVIVNLLNNAAYAVRERDADARRVTITTFSHRLPDASGREGANVALLVSDSGTGMNDAVRERIFEPFYSSKDRGEGTGLGLYISYGIVVGHGGAIEVISMPDMGATFTITLPAVAGTMNTIS